MDALRIRAANADDAVALARLPGQGMGAALVRRGEQLATQQGAHRLALTSALYRTRAHKFYKDLDYEHTGVRLAKVLEPPSRPAHGPAKARQFHVMEFSHHDEA